ncbi:unnamed protein product, partial [Urochloa humidicola]
LALNNFPFYYLASSERNGGRCVAALRRARRRAEAGAATIVPQC